MEEKKIWIVGHRNPDTDSICAAIAYADFKNRLEKKDASLKRKKSRYTAKRAGEVNAETSFVLKYFNVKAPELIDNAGTQLRDITIRRTEGVSSRISMKRAWEMMKILKVVSLPIVNRKNQLEGMIVTADIAQSYMDVYDNYTLSNARTQYKNIVDTLHGTVLTGNEHGYFVKGKVVVGVGTEANLEGSIEKDDLVILGDREEAQLLAIHEECSCLIVTNGMEVTQGVLKAAKQHDVVVISTPYETFSVARLINQSMPIKYFMTKDNLVSFHLDDYVEEVREAMTKVRHRDFPVLDENQNYAGMVSRRNLLSGQKKQIILVDHNEKTQAVANVEQAEILEIIDHHRLGSLETISPVYFRNQPLGCTSTIIYQMYQEQEIELTKQIAGILCSAILSDTLMFRSPTCTPVDKEAATALAAIAEINVEEFAQKMFEAGSDFNNKTEQEILNQDFKIFHSGDVSFGVSQVSAMGRGELDKVQERITPQISQMRAEKGVEMIFVMLTDILEESTQLVFDGPNANAIVKDAFGKTNERGILLEGVVSRKKQLIPALMNAIAER